ncbi:MAG: hypothetical protein HFJ55_05745 [Clostridia bacterium]|jgi:hypothetical protein|nr:hypothetical protein [Clostridia bacterium]
MKAPYTYQGKHLQHEEIFRSPFAKPTREAAEEVLKMIRTQYSHYYGWVELDAWIEETPNGFVAMRHHAMYK